MDGSEDQRRAEWIWTRPPRRELAGLIPRGEADFSEDRNCYVYFRREFELLGAADAASLRASADGRYILYLNGIRIGRGPARCHPGWQYVDPWDIADQLRPGKNVLAALVHSYGRDTSWYELPRGSQALLFGCGGFYLEARIHSERERVVVDTDASWRCMLSKAWERDTPFGGTGFVERFDAALEPLGWNLPGFDDSGWSGAQVQRISFPAGGGEILPFPRLVERDIAALRDTLTPPRGPVFGLPASTTAARSPVFGLPASTTAARSPAFGLPANTIATAPGDTAIRVFDFGRILLGRVRLEVDAALGSVADLLVGECLGSDGLVFQPAAIPGISTPFIHRLRFREGRQIFTQFEAAGFRFLQLSFRDGSRPIELLSVLVEESSYPADHPGDFACSDEVLTEIWRAGAYTAAVCRQDGLIDCPSREQRQWTGDAYIQSLLNYVTDGDARLVRKILLQSAQTQRPDGMIMMSSTSDLGAAGRTFIPDYSLYWVMAIERYVLYTGDRSCLFELFPSVAKAIAWFIPYIDGQGLLADTPGWIFIDWSECLDRRGAVLVLNALFVAALGAASRIADLVGATEYGRRWEAVAAKVKAAADKGFWDGTRGLYADARSEVGLSATASQQGNAAAVAFGIAPAERWEALFDAILDEERLKLTKTWRWDVERPFDPGRDLILAQPFFSHFLHVALDAADRVGDLVANIRKRWSAMLVEGNSFWESWQLTEMTSRCHAFSATPTYDLSTYVLGVRPIADGFSRFRIRPWLSGLEWARGRVPTPAGMLTVAWQRRGGTLEIEIGVPEGQYGELELGGVGGAQSPLDLAPGTNNFTLSFP